MKFCINQQKICFNSTKYFVRDECFPKKLVFLSNFAHLMRKRKNSRESGGRNLPNYAVLGIHRTENTYTCCQTNICYFSGPNKRLNLYTDSRSCRQVIYYMRHTAATVTIYTVVHTYDIRKMRINNFFFFFFYFSKLGTASSRQFYHKFCFPSFFFAFAPVRGQDVCIVYHVNNKNYVNNWKQIDGKNILYRKYF